METHSRSSLVFYSGVFLTTFLLDTTFLVFVLLFCSDCCYSVCSFVFSDKWRGCDGVLFTGVRTLPPVQIISEMPRFFELETCGDRSSCWTLLFPA